MRRWLLIISAASMLVYAFAAGAADYGSSSPGAGSSLPVAQTLVREGDFAVKLAAVLDIGTPTTEAAAEDVLVQVGVAPLNGWLSDYPMTPQIIGQLQESISRAASEGKLPMTSDQAVRGLYTITAQFNLPTPAGQGSASSQGTPPPAPAAPQVIDDYYYDTGPPIVTYYPPPYDYAYLYAWVPYPVWWFGFWFPGFYICNSFTTVVVFQSRTVVVSNHFVDRRTGHVVTVDPVGLPGGHGRRPETVLRTERGEGYRTLADMRHGARIAGLSGANGRWSAEARRSAEAIYSHSMRVSRPEREGSGREYRGGTGSPRTYGDAVRRPTEERTRGAEHNWSASSPRYASPPATMMRENSEGWGRHFSGQNRPFSNEILSSPTVPRSPSPGSGSGGRGVYTARPATPLGEGWQGNQGIGGAFSGGACRGRC